MNLTWPAASGFPLHCSTQSPLNFFVMNAIGYNQSSIKWPIEYTPTADQCLNACNLRDTYILIGRERGFVRYQVLHGRDYTRVNTLVPPTSHFWWTTHPPYISHLPIRTPPKLDVITLTDPDPPIHHTPDS